VPLNLTLVKGNSIVGVFWGRFNIEEPAKSAANNEVIMEWVAASRLSPVVQRSFSLADAVEAFRWVADRNAIGRVVVTP
jgi:NADPH2:quinone reductase